MLRNLDELKATVKDKAKIEDFFRLEGFDLQPKGSNYRVLCPFHDDSDPSLVVSPARQSWRCWVCADGGDTIDYTQRRYNLSYTESLKYIAQKVGIDLTKFEKRPEDYTPEEAQRFRALEMYKRFTEWAHSNLRAEDFAFFEKRGISRQTLDDFKIGYCPSPLVASFAFKHDELELVDVFRNRSWNELAWTDVLVYPIANEDGQIVAFHNRRYIGGEPKYVGTENSKRLQRDIPFGINLARRNAMGRFIAVEGCNDVLACHSHGFNNTVSVLGISPTQQHFKLFNSLRAKRLTWIPDPDKAGENSLGRIPNVVDGLQIVVNTLPAGDPDEFLLASGRAEFQKILDTAKLPVEYAIDKAFSRSQVTSMTDRVTLLQELSKFIAPLQKVEFELACRKVAEHLLVDESLVRDFYLPQTTEQKTYDQDMERLVLSSMIADKECLFVSISKLKKEDFYLSRHMALFEILVDLSDAVSGGVIQNLNYEVLLAEINRLGRSKLFDDGQFLVGFLYGSKPDNFDFAVSTVKSYSRRRRLVEELGKHIGLAKNQATEISAVVSSALTSISAITTEKTGALVDVENMAVAWMETFCERIERKGVLPGIGIGQHLKNLNHLLGGLRSECLILIGGDSGVGKTNIALDFMIGADKDTKMLFISTEMSESQLMDRIIAKVSGVSAEKISLGIGLTEDEMARVRFAAVRMVDCKERFICMSGLTIAEVTSIIRHEKLKSGLDCVFVDYAQRINVPGIKPGELYSKGAEVSGQLKDLTLELKMPIVLNVQLDRSSHQNANPTGGNVAESYRLRQDSDQFVIISKKTQKQIDNRGGEGVVGNANIYLDKNRHGRDGVLLDAFFSRVDLTWREMLVS